MAALDVSSCRHQLLTSEEIIRSQGTFFFSERNISTKKKKIIQKQFGGSSGSLKYAFHLWFCIMGRDDDQAGPARLLPPKSRHAHINCQSES